MSATNRPSGVRLGLAALSAIGLAISLPASAEEPLFATSAPTMSHGEKLRRLDIMLMVTGLRCRTTADDFQADFQDFEAHHLAELNAAALEMRDGLSHERDALSHELGLKEANARIDRLSVAMANQYGNGHPWLGCGELKAVAHDLAGEPGEAPLLAAAEQLLNGAAPAGTDHETSPQLAYAGN